MSVTEHLVEDSTQVEAIMKLLDVGSDGVRFIGIHGTGGVGKTTLAKVMFNRFSLHFGSCCFLADVRASSQLYGGLLNLQKQLLSSFVSSMFIDPIENVEGGITMIKKVFRNKKVLVILDDLHEKEQLENLAGKSNWFCSGTRIIITTREESILKTQVDQPKGILPYEVLGMSFDLALDLFDKYACRSDFVIEEYEDHSREIVPVMGMLPLAVVVVGSHLYDLGNDLGHLDKREVWDETLKQLKEGPFDEVRKTLMISYKRLENKEKKVFLDLACCFNNNDKAYPFIMWKDCDYYPATTMRVLSFKSLVKIRDENKFWMHDQVQDFGRYIVLEEYPHKFCRLWIREKALNLLERKERNEDVEALSPMFDGHCFTREELACLPRLRFLRVKESDFSGNFENLLSELRWLSWQIWQTTFHAKNFHFINLVVLELSDSGIEDGWDGWSQMKNASLLWVNTAERIGPQMEFNGTQALVTIILALIGGVLALRQLVKSKRRRDSESTSRADDASREENEAIQRGTESTSRMDDASGEEYDVFLSFRGSDTRQNITNILYRRMVDAGIRVFLDNEEIQDGGKINEVLKAVKNSQIYIPIFSQHFADSVWCLREVECMVECHSKPNGNKEIIPIFYDVTPDDVKLKTNRYKKSLRKHKDNFFLSLFGLKRRGKYDSSRVQQWEKALQMVGGIFGRELQGKRQGEEIDSIVEGVSRKLNTGHVTEPEILVEDIPQLQAIMKLLDVGSDGVRYVGIHGMGGIGKTTLATIVYNKLRVYFDGFSFLHDVRVQWQHPGGPSDLQKRLLSDFVSSGIIDQIKDDGGIKKVLGKKNVLIVLDDLDQKEQLQKLAGKYDWFGSRSRIIFTTRNREVLTTQVELSNKEPKRISGHEVQRMEYSQALELFCRHAFSRVSPEEVYALLVDNVVRKVGMLPLSIQVIGSHISGLDFALESPDIQKQLLEDTLRMLNQGGFDNVRQVLMISYKGLKRKEDKEIFLDIACFFTNEDQTYPIMMWDDCKYCPHTAIRVLQQRSLIKIIGKKLWMHDQVRDLGRHIVHEEHTPKFSRVWEHDDVVELLQRKQRNEDVEALSLTSGDNSHKLVNEELAALPKLRFLQAKGSDFSGDFRDLLSKLRWLSWHTWQTTFQAENLHFSRLLVLNLSNSNIKDDWDAWSQMKMDKLKVLDLTDCTGLTRTPNLSNFTSLETLILARCAKLATIDVSIDKLQRLRTFDINGCKALRELPVEFGSLQSLTEIIMPKHYHPFKLPETFGGLHSLTSLILDEHLGIIQLPNSIGGLVKLTRLSLCECAQLQKLPSSIGEMTMLAELDLSKSGIDELPDSIGFLKKLKVIKVSYTKISKFPHTFGDIEMLEELHAKKCSNLTDENLEKIGKLSHLRTLDMSYTAVDFPAVLGGLSRLETLEMSTSHPQKVPDLPSSLKHLHMQAPHFPIIPDLSSLVKLHYLELSLLTLPMEPDESRTNDPLEEEVSHPLPSSLSTMKFRGVNLLPLFSNVKNLSEMSLLEYPMQCFFVSQDLASLTILKLRKCESLEKICDLKLLEKLSWLELNKLKSLVEIDDLLGLKSLEHFRIAYCEKIESLPNLSSLGKLRRIEIEACPNIREIQGLKGIESFELDNRGCTILERLLNDPESTWLPHRIPTYDVFLSFRGIDNRYTIVEILYKNLLRSKFRVYMVDEAVCHGGLGISSDLQIALDDSHIYLPFLSKNFASSRWCIYELVRMVERKKSDGKIRILPIFYNVDKADVKLESNLYRDALKRHTSLYGDKTEWGRTLKECEEAFSYVGDMDGYSLKTNSLEELIDLVAQEVSEELLDANMTRAPAVED